MQTLDWVEWGQYPYLITSLGLFLVFSLVFAFEKRHRQLLLFGGLGSCLFSFSSVVFVPEYWNPVRLCSFVVGPEDLIFSFANGGMIWVLATWHVHHRLIYSCSARTFFKRFLFCTMAGMVITFPGWLLGLDTMPNCLIGMAAMGSALMFVKRGFWRIAIMGGASFSLLYALVMGVGVYVFPHFADQWTHGNLWGPTLLTLPIEEFVWALGFGSVFPLILAVSADVRMVENPA